MAQCCPPNSLPGLNLKEKKTNGTIITHKSAQFYATGQINDATGRRAVVFMPDAFGWDSGRTRLIADHMATQLNVLVVVLKSLLPYKGGEDGLPTDYDFVNATDVADRTAWMLSVTWEGVVKGRVADLLEYLEEHKCGGIGLVGFCWGGWATSYIAAEFPSKIKCQAIPHPSIGLETMMGKDPVALCKRVKCPTFFLPGVNDPDSYRTGGDMFTAVKENNPHSKSSEHEFDGVKHGWVPRSPDEELPLAMRAVDLVLEFTKEHLFK